MTPEDIRRLDELHGKGNIPSINSDFLIAIRLAWPAISAELTRLREFETAVREAMNGAKHDYERVGEVSIAIDDLGRKRGEHNES